MRSKATNGGFTLVEVLAAMLFLAILIPAIAGALTLASRVSSLAERGHGGGAGGEPVE